MDRLMMEMFYQTGIRLSELMNLKKSDISSGKIKVLGKEIRKESFLYLQFKWIYSINFI